MSNKKTIIEPERKLELKFPVVAIGSSAGGLEALTIFFDNLPSGTGIAYVVIPHLSPDVKSSMSDIISKHTEIPVNEILHGVKAEPDNVYVIPPGKDLLIKDKELLVRKPVTEKGIRHTIDRFFRSLASEEQENAACVVLSGTGKEGTLGLKEIKDRNGLVIVQDPDTAKYPGMPSSAVSTGLADYILPPEKMPSVLADYFSKMRKDLYAGSDTESSPVNKRLDEITAIIKNTTGQDFSKYKKSTLIRRIQRRMVVMKFTDVSEYVEYLRKNNSEQKTLLKEFLIGVTRFFRDPEAFEILKKEYLPAMLSEKSQDNPARIWTTGCATGEEAYSLAMIVSEYMEENEKNFPVQIFATDLDEEFLDVARKGMYPDTISEDVSTKRLNQFFVAEHGDYRVKKFLREMIVFAQHNVTSNPPFSNLDLISCRNLLIYMGPELQERTLSVFSYSLKSEGILFLGTSETVGQTKGMFDLADKKWKIFKKKPGAYRTVSSAIPLGGSRRQPYIRQEGIGKDKGYVLSRIISSFKEELLSKHSPPAVLIREDGEIIYIHGRTGRYLEPPSGRGGIGNIFEMSREGLKLKLKSLASDAVKRGEETSGEVKIRTNGGFQEVNLAVTPHKPPLPMQGLLSVTFNDIAVEGRRPAASPKKTDAAFEEKSDRERELEQEIDFTRKSLTSTLKELEDSNEEMKLMNEDLQSSNEEMQSSNEELETSQEELRSVNEELTVSNSELLVKIDELTQANNDLNNLFLNTGIAVVFLDRDLRIRRFTPIAEKLMNFIESDVDRPFNDISPKLKGADLAGVAEDVIKDAQISERELKDSDGNYYLARIMPYRTELDVIDGVVITLTDITLRIKAEEVLVRDKKKLEEIVRKSTAELVSSKNYSESIIETVRDSILVLDPDLKVVSANRSFYSHFNVTKKESEGVFLFDLGNKQWDIPQLRRLLTEVISEKTTVEDFEVTHFFPEIGKRTLLLNARTLISQKRILLYMEDITEKKIAEETNTKLEARMSEMGTMATTVAHELRNPLATLKVAVANLKRKQPGAYYTGKLETMDKKIDEAGYIIENILNYARVKTPQGENIKINNLINEAVSSVEKIVPDHSAEIKINLGDIKDLEINVDPVQIGEVFRNILLNAFQAVEAKPGPRRISITGTRADGFLKFGIKDNGGGIEKKNLDNVFKPFWTLKSKGTGLGLGIALEFMKLHGGNIEIDSQKGKGTTVTIILPEKDIFK